MPPSDRSPATILVVEDNSTARAALADILELLGYAVLDAADGRSAVELLEKWSGTIDLILSDLALPGMNGVELAQAVRKLRPGLPLLVVTGYSLAGGEEELAAHGVAGWLQKPFTLDQLAGKIAETVSQ